jgi:8-oxo-dGTP diphosphatase
MASDNDTKGILVILVDREGRLLLQLREAKQGIALPGVWSVPGGALETGESPVEGARRELQEETGQAVESLHFVGSVRPARRTAYVFSGGARFAEGAIVVGEGQVFRFFSWQEIRRLQPTAPFVIPLLNDFMAGPLYERCRQDAQQH